MCAVEADQDRSLHDTDALDDSGGHESGDTVTGKVFCFFCGRDLHGVAVDGRCPQCARSVLDTIRGDQAVESSPDELRRLADAANLVYYPAVLLSVMGVITLAAAVLRNLGNILEDITVVFDYAFFMAMLSPCVSLVGILVLTRRRSPAYYMARYGNPRSIAGLLGMVVGGAVVIVLALVYLGRAAEALLQVTWFAIPNMIFLRGLGRLMRRVRYKRLAKFLNVAAVWTLVLSLAALLVQLLRWGAAEEAQLAGPRIALAWITLIAGISLWIIVLRLIMHSRATLLRLKR